MHKDIDTSILRAFVAVAETGSVTSAARLLNRTQAAVSQQIKRLEQHFGVELFRREHKRIFLGPDGERLLGSAQRLLSMNDATWGMMTTPSFQGEVRLGIPDDIIATYASSILRRFNAAWPQVRVTIEACSTQRLTAALDDGAIDLTLTTDLATSRPCETLFRDQLVWVASAADTTHAQRPLPLTVGSATCCFRPCTFEALAACGIEWRSIIEVSNHEAMCAPVEAGLAVTVLLAETVPSHLVVLGAEHGLPPLPCFDINLHLPHGGGSDLAQALAAEIRADFAARYGSPEAWSDRARPAA
jgi:DNA-binding transcriptional LysR family regulator